MHYLSAIIQTKVSTGVLKLCVYKIAPHCKSAP